jgi:hypothetical protein
VLCVLFSGNWSWVSPSRVRASVLTPQKFRTANLGKHDSCHCSWGCDNLCVLFCNTESKLASNTIKKNTAHKNGRDNSDGTFIAKGLQLKQNHQQQSDQKPFNFYSTQSLVGAGVVVTILFLVLYMYTTHSSVQTRHRKSIESPRRQLDRAPPPPVGTPTPAGGSGSRRSR